MPLFMYEASYTAESLAAQIKQPQDRLEAVKPALDRVGARLVVGGYAFGEYDVVAIVEAPDDTAIAAMALAFAAGGAIRAARTTKLLTGAEWVTSLQRAQEVAPQYKAARQPAQAMARSGTCPTCPGSPPKPRCRLPPAGPCPM